MSLACGPCPFWHARLSLLPQDKHLLPPRREPSTRPDRSAQWFGGQTVALSFSSAAVCRRLLSAVTRQAPARRDATPRISAIASKMIRSFYFSDLLATGVRYASCARSSAMFITRAPHSVVFVPGAAFPRPLLLLGKDMWLTLPIESSGRWWDLNYKYQRPNCLPVIGRISGWNYSPCKWNS